MGSSFRPVGGTVSNADYITTVDDANCEEAYNRVLSEATALPSDRLIPVTIDVRSGVITVMGVWPKLKTIEGDARALPQFSPACFDKMLDYTFALTNAQSRYEAATTPPEALPELLDQATKQRDIFFGDANALVVRGHLNGDAVKEFKGMHGYKNVAFDLMGITQLLKTSWPDIENHTGLKMNELVEADKIAVRLMAAIGHREQSPAAAASATDIRLRMFTLFIDAYDQVRRAAIFLRWDRDDADTIAPSLYAGRTLGAKKAAAQTTNQTPATEGNAPVPATTVSMAFEIRRNVGLSSACGRRYAGKFGLARG
jgi:hypothetical protein